jgi:hypothetical protein
VSEVHVLLVTSASADPAAVVPVLAACEAADLRVRAIDVGGAGAGGGGLSDRVRRVLVGETAQRRLRRELDGNPPDVTLAFDPFAAQALSVARDQAANPAPVVAVVPELEPAAAWAEAAADRYCAVDDVAAVALADAGVEGDRILVAGPLGERAYADAAGEERAALRARFTLQTPAVVVEVAGLSPELVGQLTMQLSLGSLSERLTYLFDAGADVDVAAVLRRQVPALGLRAKLFGQTADAARYWRAADVVVARPTTRAVARARLVGARLLALIDDEVPQASKIAAALEARGVGAGARGLLLLSSGLEQAMAAAGTPLPRSPDGADQVIEVIAAVAGDRRAVIEERRASAREETHARLRTAAAAASAAARVAAMPGELEDLGGAPLAPDPPPAADLEALRREAVTRKQQLLREVDAARKSAEAADRHHSQARRDGAETREHERRAADERTAMHKLLAELAALDSELAELERATSVARAAGVQAPPRPGGSAGASGIGTSSGAAPAGGATRPSPDPLAELKARTARASQRSSASLEDELAALKRKMADTPKKR